MRAILLILIGIVFACILSVYPIMERFGHKAGLVVGTVGWLSAFTWLAIMLWLFVYLP